MAKITCEGCYEVIAEDTDEAEAEELAFEADAHHDQEAGIWQCAPCYDATIAQWYAELPVLSAENVFYAYRDDAHENGAMAAYLRAKGQM